MNGGNNCSKSANKTKQRTRLVLVAILTPHIKHVASASGFTFLIFKIT
jgi:hypothetical protein